MLVHIPGTSILHHGSQIHHRRLIRNMAHHRQIMSDKQISQIHFFLELHQHIDYLGLNGHIQCGDRLITDDKFRI